MFFNREKRIANLQKQNKCPDCNGRGIHYFVGSDFFVSSPIHCPSCNGTGKWANSVE